MFVSIQTKPAVITYVPGCDIWVHCCSGYLSFCYTAVLLTHAQGGQKSAAMVLRVHRGRAGDKLSRMYKTVDQAHFPRVRAQLPPLPHPCRQTKALLRVASHFQASTLQIRREHFLMPHPRGHQHNPCSTTASYVLRAMALWRWKLTRYDHRPQGELAVCERVSIAQAELAHEMRDSPARSSESRRPRPYTSCKVTPVSLYHLL